MDSFASDPDLSLLIDVAHDFRSPLTSILFLSEALRANRGQPIGATQERQLMLIYSAAFELSALANDLTELGRGGAGLLEREPVPFSLPGVLTSVRDIVRPLAEEKDVEVRLSPISPEQRIGHPAALSRVLLNLVTNALRCTDEGFVEIAVQPVEEPRVGFFVKDTGPGVPDEVLDGLRSPIEEWSFDPGERRFSSSGLGLLICRRLLAAMGSELEAARLGDRGASFHFVLELPVAHRGPS